MSQDAAARQIKRVRSELLVVLKLLYPAAMTGEQILRSLLPVFPQLEWGQVRKDLAYLCEKGYVQRITAASEPDPRLTPYRRRWFRLTPAGVEVADHCVEDQALE